MKETTVLVTGATDGIGLQTALELARSGAHVLLHGRNAQRGEDAMRHILQAVPQARLSFFLADFASLQQVRQLAESIRSDHEHLQVLVNNAGTFSKTREMTEDGFELTFAVNHLAPFLLTMLLLDLLKASAPARIVTVASNAHRNISALDFSNLQGEQSYDGYQAYALSKLANILFSNGLAHRLQGSGVSSNSLHPGTIDTKLLRMSWNSSGSSLEEGAQTSIYLAISAEAAGVNGRFFSRMTEKSPSELAQDEQLQERLWEISMQMVAPFME